MCLNYQGYYHTRCIYSSFFHQHLTLPSEPWHVSSAIQDFLQISKSMLGNWGLLWVVSGQENVCCCEPVVLITNSSLSLSTGHDSEPFEEGAVVPSAPPMEHMDHFQGYEQVSFEAGRCPLVKWSMTTPTKYRQSTHIITEQMPVVENLWLWVDLFCLIWLSNFSCYFHLMLPHS